VTRVIAGLLFGVSPTDPLAFTAMIRRCNRASGTE